jgi:hypothetical protein
VPDYSFQTLKDLQGFSLQFHNPLIGTSIRWKLLYQENSFSSEHLPTLNPKNAVQITIKPTQVKQHHNVFLVLIQRQPVYL